MSKRAIYQAGQSVADRLTYLDEAENRGRHRYIRCLCSCGCEKDFKLSHIRSGSTTSCGCAGREKSAAARTTHGGSENPLYGTWWQMLERCENSRHPSFTHYGARGITVCEEWSDRIAGFAAFLRDMGNRPSGCSLDRIDNNKGYSKGNCEWARHSLQVRNRSKRKGKTSRFMGVSWDSRGGNWRSNIRIKGKQTYLGCFETEEKAFLAYCEAYEKHVGRKAPEYFEAETGGLMNEE